MATLLQVAVESEPHTQDLTGVLLNRPAPQGGSFLIASRIEKADFGAVKAAGAWYVDAELLEDMDMFDARPGWRYSLDALKVLLAQGYALAVRDVVVADAATLDALFTEEAKAAYWQRIADEKAAAAAHEHQRRVAKQQAHEDEVQRWRAWQAEHLAGLVETTIGVTDTPGAEHIPDQDIHFDAGWSGTGTRYSAYLWGGETIWRSYYGNAVKTYCSPALADGLYQEQWAQSGEGDMALKALGDDLDGYSVMFSDISQWAMQHFGKEQLIALARKHAPLNDFSHYRAFASKVYRVPVINLDGFTADAPRHIGYGEYGHKPGNVAPDQQARQTRMEGWVPLGEEDRGEWPTEDDIAWNRAERQQMSTRFSAIFGDS